MSINWGKHILTILIVFFLFQNFETKGQACDPLTPTFTIDLTNNADSVWTSTSIKRVGLCCGATGSDKCAEFIVTLNPYTTGIRFEISSGAVPPGAMFYEINCANPTAVGDTICLNGVGPHRITFCKPGNSENEYRLTAISRPNFSAPVYVSDACKDTLGVSGLVKSSITWKSVPNNPTHDGYLSCNAGCDTTILTFDPSAPDSVNYEVKGLLVGACSNDTIRDTVTVKFISDKLAKINPLNPKICFNGTTTKIYANMSGGAPPFNYLWSTGATTDSIDVPQGTYWVKVTDQDNCPAVYDTVTVTKQLAPITADAGTNQSLCSNTPSFNLKGMVTVATGGTWSGGAGTYSPKNDTTDITYTPDPAEVAAGSVKLYFTSTGNGGCAAVTDSLTLTMYPSSVANFTADSVCLGAATIFNNTSTFDAGGSPTFNWDFGDGNTSTSQNPTNTFASAGDYNVKLIVSANGSCNDTITKTVTVLPMPTANFSLNNSCIVDTAYFTDASTVPSGSISNWSWSFGDGNTSTAQNGKNEYAAFGTYNVKLVVTHNLGCKDSITQSINVYHKPVANFTFDTACLGSNSNFIDGSTVKSGAVSSWNWNFGDGNTATLQNPSIGYGSSGTFNVQLIATSNGNCKDTVTKSVLVLPSVSADFSLLDTCLVDTAYFTDASSVSSGSISNWAWNFGDGNTSTIQNAKNDYASSGNYNVKLVVTHAQGCTDSVTKSFNIGHKPFANFSFAQTCLGTSQNFTDASTIKSGSIANWNWDFGDANTSTTQNPSNSYISDGEYSVQLIVEGNTGCKDTLIKKDTIWSKPVVNFNLTPQCFQDTVSFTDVSSVTWGNISSWNWDLGNSKSSSLQNPKNVYTPGNYTVKLVVQTDKSCTDSLSKSFNIYPAPVADFTVPNVCLGTVTNFTDNTTISSGSIASWTWDLGDGTTSNSQNPSKTYAVDSSYTVELIVNSNDGCKDTISKTVVVNSVPNASFVGSSLCVVDSLQFTNNSTIKNGAITNWFWDFGDGNNSTNQAPKHLYTAGSYTVKLKATSDSGCVDSVTQGVTIFPGPGANFGFDDVCLGKTTTFSDSSTIATGVITNWDWDFGDGNTSTSQNPTHTYLVDSTYSVKLVTTSNNGCKDSITKTVVVNSMPQVSFVAAPQCFIDTVQFNNTSSIKNGSIANWVWDFGDATSSNLQKPKKIFSPGTYTVKLVATSNANCIDSASASLSIFPAPVAKFGFNEVCEGTATQFSDSSNVTGDVITSYQWDLGDGSSSTLKDPLYTYTNDSTFNVRLIVTTANNCKDTLTKSLTVWSNPVVDFGGSPTCFIDSVQFSDLTTLNLGNINSWSWNFGDGNFSNSQNPKHKFAPGTYNVSLNVSSDKGCVGSKITALNIYPSPKTGFLNNEVCSGGVNVFTDTSKITSDIITQWNWDFGDGNTSTTQNPNHTYLIDSVYTVQLITTSSNGCKDTASKSITVWSKPNAQFFATPQCFIDTINFLDQSTSKLGTINSWAWDLGDGNTSTSQNPKNLYSPGTYNVQLIVNTDKGCKDTILQNLNIFPSPIAGFSTTELCFGGTNVFTDTSKINNGNIVSWAWDFGDGNTSTIQNPNHKYLIDSTYTVQLITTSANNCKDTVTKNVTLWSKPKAQFFATPQCYIDTVQFIDQSTAKLGTINAWNWDLGDGNKPAIQSPKNKYTPGVYNVELIISMDKGCKDTLQQSLNIYPSPIAGFMTSEICFGDSNVFADTSKINNDVITNWSWDFGDGNTSNMQNLKHKYLNDSVYNVKLVVTSSNNCKDSVTKTITVWSKPSADFNLKSACRIFF